MSEETPTKTAASNSFSKREIALIILMLREETRRPSSALSKNPEFGTIYKKFLGMSAKTK
jgi:hypothetical protein